VSLYWPSILSLLALTLLANGVPALLSLVCGRARPLDAGRTLADGGPLLGPSKTWRGLLGALVGTTLGALLLGLSWGLGVVVAVGAMCGDLATSFLKRRLGLAPSASLPVLDQVPEALLPGLLVKAELALGWADLGVSVLAFCALDLVLTNLGRRLLRPQLRD
jgi:CDP-2,3-bis-(O-geranylgeranyl)-sn-glycerol synthase